MKREKLNLKIQKRLVLVRTTITKLTPEQLEQVHGGAVTVTCQPTCSNPYSL